MSRTPRTCLALLFVVVTAGVIHGGASDMAATNVGPYVTIVSPEPDANLGSDDLVVEVSFATAKPGPNDNGAHGNVGLLELFVDGALRDTYRNPPSVKSGSHTFAPVVLAGWPDGTYTIKACAYQANPNAGLRRCATRQFVRSTIRIDSLGSDQASPAAVLILQGENFLPDEGGVRVLFGETPAPVLRVSETSLTTMVPFGLGPMTGVSVEHDDGSRSNSYPLIVEPLPEAVLTPDELAEAFEAGVGAMLQRSGELIDVLSAHGALPAGDAVAVHELFDRMQSGLDAIVLTVRGMSPQDANYLESAMRASGLLETMSGAARLAALGDETLGIELPQTGLHRALFFADAVDFVAADVVAITDALGLISLIPAATPITGPVYAALLPAQHVARVISLVIEAVVPTELVVDPDDLAFIGEDTTVRFTVTAVEGEQLNPAEVGSLRVYGLFAPESGPVEVSLELLIEAFGDLAEALYGGDAGQLVDEELRPIIDGFFGDLSGNLLEDILAADRLARTVEAEMDPSVYDLSLGQLLGVAVPTLPVGPVLQMLDALGILEEPALEAISFEGGHASGYDAGTGLFLATSDGVEQVTLLAYGFAPLDFGLLSFLTLGFEVPSLRGPFSAEFEVIAASEPGEIDPDDVVVVLGEGESFSIEIPFTTDEGGVFDAADIVLVVDVSGSYQDDLPTFRSQAQSIMDEARLVIPDSWFGLTSFRDFPLSPFGSSGDWAFRLEVPVTAQTDQIVAGLQGLVAFGGNDSPESQYEALFQTSTGLGHDLNGDGDFLDVGDVPPVEVGFRPGTLPVAFLATDASFHDSDFEPAYPGYGGGATLAALQDRGVTVFGLGSGYVPPQLDSLAAATGGDTFLLGSDSQGIAEAIQEALIVTTTSVDISMAPDGDTFGFVQSVAPGVHTDVGPGETIVFGVTFEGTVGSSGTVAVFGFELTILGDGVAELVHIPVTVIVP